MCLPKFIWSTVTKHLRRVIMEIRLRSLWGSVVAEDKAGKVVGQYCGWG